MDENDIDDFAVEVDELLDQLDHNDEYMPDVSESELESEPKAKVDDASPPLQLAEQIISQDELSTDQVINGQRQVINPLEHNTQLTETTLLELPLTDLRKHFEQLDAVTDEVLQGARHDRQETQDAIKLMRGEIDKAIGNQTHPARMYVDNLVKALEVKATVNMTVVKIMEAKAKMLSATKVGTVINNTNNVNNQQNVIDRDLTRLLEEPLGASDEY